MKAFLNFIHDINKLEVFYKSTVYTYDQTEKLLQYQKKNRILFDIETENGLLIKQPHVFKSKSKSNRELRQHLREIVFVRVVSSLEVLLVDMVRDIFIESKEPFKKQDIKTEFSQAELLSVESTSEIYAKIINKETRKLSSGGFLDIIKFYKKYFDIELSNLAPGKNKMEKYHDRRHLLVHRLGKTDVQYRNKYITTKQGISIEEDYLLECIKDFKYFCDLVNNQVTYKLKNQFTKKHARGKKVERKVFFRIEIEKETYAEYLSPDFEFWANDEYSRFSDILDSTTKVESNIFECNISGTFRQIKIYMRILKQKEKKREIKLFVRDIFLFYLLLIHIYRKRNFPKEY